MNDTFSPPETEDREDLLPIELLKAGGPDPDWRTPYVQYLTHGTKWESDLIEPELKLIAYRSQSFILKEEELHCIFHNNVFERFMPGKYVRSYIKTFHIRENRHYSVNATLQLNLQEPYWWPTIAEDLSWVVVDKESSCPRKETPTSRTL